MTSQHNDEDDNIDCLYGVIMTGFKDHKIVYEFNPDSLLWESTGQEVEDYLSTEIDNIIDAVEQKIGMTFKDKDWNSLSKDIANSFPTRSVGDLYGMIACKSDMYLDMGTLEFVPRSKKHLCWEEYNAEYIPDMTDDDIQEISDALIKGTTSSKKKYLLEIGSVLANGGSIKFDEKKYPLGAKKMNNILHTIFDGTFIKDRFLSDELTNDKFVSIPIKNFDSEKFGPNVIFTWICTLGHRFWCQ